MLKRLGMFLFVSGFVSLGAMEIKSNLPMNPPTQEGTRLYLREKCELKPTKRIRLGTSLLLNHILQDGKSPESYVELFGPRILITDKAGFISRPASPLAIAFCLTNHSNFEVGKKIGNLIKSSPGLIYSISADSKVKEILNDGNSYKEVSDLQRGLKSARENRKNRENDYKRLRKE